MVTDTQEVNDAVAGVKPHAGVGRDVHLGYFGTEVWHLVIAPHQRCEIRLGQTTKIGERTDRARPPK